jgi:hypothetical protein
MTYGSNLTAEERLGSLFQPDPVLPAQYFETFRRKMPLEPEIKLMFAVLEDAIMCFHKYALARNVRSERLFREAEDWILEQDSDWLFSFENICSTLGLDPSYLRRGLTQRKEKLLPQSLEAKRCSPSRETEKDRQEKRMSTCGMISFQDGSPNGDK